MKARFFAIAALVLGLASCQQDFAPDTPPSGGEVSVQLVVSAPELIGATRAGEDGEIDGNKGMDSAFGAIDYLDGAVVGDARFDWDDVNIRYTMEVYDVNDLSKPIKDRQEQITDKYEPVQFEVRLIPNRKYQFVVFADFVDQTTNEALRHQIGETLNDITLINEPDEELNDEVSDCYFKSWEFYPEDNTQNQTEATLTRPYAKVRVIATDLDELNLNVHPENVTIEYYDAVIPTAFNAVTGSISGDNTTKNFSYNYIAEVRNNMAKHVYNANYDALVDTETGRATHMTLFTDYILAKDEQSSIHFKMTVSDKIDAIKVVDFNTEIPIQRNYLTTVIGNVLTTNTQVDITINDNFTNSEKIYDAPFFVEIWDGESITAPQPDPEDPSGETIIISQPSELAWLAAAVNGTLNRASEADDFAGKTFKLSNDIDLNNEQWTPIGYIEGSFAGTFDGCGHTIANLRYHNTKEDDWCVGLFGSIDGATIKNLTLENVDINVYGGNFGAVAAISDNAVTFENITIKGDVKLEGTMDYSYSYYIGTILGTAQGGNSDDDVTLKNITIDVNEDSYVKGRTNIGGVVGCTLGETTITDLKSNIDVFTHNGIAGGIVGRLQHNSKIENCVADGNVTRVNAVSPASDKYRIGGIVGVWESTVGSVELINTEFNGELSTADDIVLYDYNKYVGRGTKTNGNGKLFINGYEWVSPTMCVDSAGEYYVYVDDVTTLQAALDLNIQGKLNIFIVKDIVGSANIPEIAGRKVVVNGNNNKYDGYFYIVGGSNYDSTILTVLENINFETADASAFPGTAFVYCNEQNGNTRYPDSLTVKNCTFTATDAAVDLAVGIKLRSLNGDLNIESVTADGLHSLAQLLSCGKANVVVDNTTIANGKNGISLEKSGKVVIKNSNIAAREYGVRADGCDATTAIENSTIAANQPVIIRKVNSGNYALSFNGANTLNTDNEYQVVFTNASDDVAYVIPTAQYTLTGAEDFKVYPRDLIAGLPYNGETKSFEAQNALGLAALANCVNNGENDFSGFTVTLSEDIDLQSVDFQPIGTADNKFNGTFDGQGKTISNLKIDSEGAVAMFAYVGEEAAFKNVTLENVDIKSDRNAAGLLYCNYKDASAAYNGGNLLIENVTVSGNIECPNYAAGIAFDLANVTMKNCVNNANVVAGASAGLVAWIEKNGVLENVVNNGNVFGGTTAAGIANRFGGSIKNATNNGEITAEGPMPAAGIVAVNLTTSTYDYCYNYGKVVSKYNGANASAAGILGQAPSTKHVPTFNYCANFDEIVAEQSHASGIFYSLYGAATANYCYNAGAVTGADGAGAIAAKPEFSGSNNINYCLDGGVATATAAINAKGKNVYTSCYYYNNGELLNVADNTAADVTAALAALNGGADAEFFTNENGVIVVK